MTHTKRQGFSPTWKSTLEFEDIFNGLFLSNGRLVG